MIYDNVNLQEWNSIILLIIFILINIIIINRLIFI